MSTILIELVSQGTEPDEPGDGSMAHAFIERYTIRDTFPLGMSFAESLESELPDDSGSLANSIRGKATSRVESTDSK